MPAFPPLRALLSLLALVTSSCVATSRVPEANSCESCAANTACDSGGTCRVLCNSAAECGGCERCREGLCQPAPTCGNGTGVAGQACETSTACASDAPICEDECRPCEADSECKTRDATSPWCTPIGTCVGCRDADDCLDAAAAICGTDGTCKPCDEHGECAAATPSTPVCGGDGTCQGCASRADCIGLTAPVCDTSLVACRGCAGTGDCTDAGKPFCVDSGPIAGACVECRNDGECGVAAPFCGDDGLCRGCANHTECEERDSTRPACASNGVCVECVDSSHCLLPSCSDPGGLEVSIAPCQLLCGLGNTCERCDGDNACASQSPATPQCADIYDVCVVCQPSDAYCADGDDGMAYYTCDPDGSALSHEVCSFSCGPAGCHGCDASTDCPAADPICDTTGVLNDCRPCDTDGECLARDPNLTWCSDGSSGTNAGQCYPCAANAVLRCAGDDRIVCAADASGESTESCADSYACTDDTCDVGSTTCTHTPVDTHCDDESTCTNDVCFPGASGADAAGCIYNAAPSFVTTCGSNKCYGGACMAFTQALNVLSSECGWAGSIDVDYYENESPSTGGEFRLLANTGPSCSPAPSFGPAVYTLPLTGSALGGRIGARNFSSNPLMMDAGYIAGGGTIVRVRNAALETSNEPHNFNSRSIDLNHVAHMRSADLFDTHHDYWFSGAHYSDPFWQGYVLHCRSTNGGAMSCNEWLDATARRALGMAPTGRPLATLFNDGYDGGMLSLQNSTSVNLFRQSSDPTAAFTSANVATTTFASQTVRGTIARGEREVYHYGDAGLLIRCVQSCATVGSCSAIEATEWTCSSITDTVGSSDQDIFFINDAAVTPYGDLVLVGNARLCVAPCNGSLFACNGGNLWLHAAYVLPSTGNPTVAADWIALAVSGGGCDNGTYPWVTSVAASDDALVVVGTQYIDTAASSAQPLGPADPDDRIDKVLRWVYAP